MSTDLLERAIEAIDALNAEDPNVVSFNGESLPKELLHSQRMSHWLLQLDASASPQQLIAARAHHLQRWLYPRLDYPEGRAGYLKWRKDAQRRHSEGVATILAELDAPDGLAERVSEIISKVDLKTDTEVQTHEDALCLVFFELQADALAPKLGDKTVPIVTKTLSKMSDRAKELALGLPLGEDVLGLIKLGRDTAWGSS